ncbi:MAG: transcription-repair coupling factor [Planctomycetaceae bacterium]|jgi:transcription-repair coupling factor (superfamily II helicase)|nr:transcription-repair coupling factor [Planctomycetaceae bacterium]
MSQLHPCFSELLAADGKFTKIAQKLNAGKSISIDGVIGSSCALAIASLSLSCKLPLLVVVQNQEELDRITYDLELFSSNNVNILTFPQLRELPASDIDKKKSNDNDESGGQLSFYSLSDDIFGQRIRVLKRLSVAIDRYVVVTTIASIMQPVPAVNILNSHTISLNVGDQIEINSLRLKLVGGGYHSTSAVELPGEFAVRGYIVDIFAPDWDKPVRVEFFGDEIESIRTFDIATQRSSNNIKSIDFTWLAPADSIGANLINYLPNDVPIALCNLRELKTQAETYYTRAENNSVLTDIDNLLKQIAKHPTVTISDFAEGLESEHLHLPVKSVDRLSGSLETVRKNLDELNVAQIYIFCPTTAETERLNELFADIQPAKSNRLHYVTGQISAGFEILLNVNLADVVQRISNDDEDNSGKKVSPLASKVKKLKSKKTKLDDETTQIISSEKDQLQSVVDDLRVGVSESFFILSSGELFLRRDIRRPKQHNLSRVLDSFLDLKPGDYVVHVSHGIARYRGIEVLTRLQNEEEHLHLEFADSAALYVPISKIGMVQKYIGGTRSVPRLAKLGGTLWGRHKNAAREAVFDFAVDMIDLQAKRSAAAGIAFPADSEWQLLMESSFPFKETPDQLTAIIDVKNDMQLSRPMDRLLCGDVGFGKTEVAIRAAFKAVDAGYQVAVLVPTTILAEQHAQTFAGRMNEFPVTIAALSRFQSAAEQKQIIDKIATGNIDIVIGTHRILSKEISFHNLGLVVIDEEQRFGVRHKERLKQFRESVDVLTMTATPIPRTLHFSLLGIREISNLETPPEDRLPVETHVIRFDQDIIRSAILRELNRGGQIFFVHNRIADLDELAKRLKKIVPEVRIGIGHASMDTDDLEDVMRRFLNHDFDMLISTTIIESGLDIPNANTIFIDEASHYGLADLHQLRGRVGRFKYQAYCYLVIPRSQAITANASRRLNAIKEYARLGSGFHIAMRDLEIRGAGNILGMQQSGHIAAVGYEMYCQMLEVAVRTIKQLPLQTNIEVELDLPGLAVIPISYVSDHRIKIDLYRRISRITTLEDCYDMRMEMIDRFGEPPIEVERLLSHVRLKILAHGHTIKSIRLNKGLINDSGYVVINYVSQKAIDELKTNLAKKQTVIRFTPEERNGYILLPSNMTPTSDPDKILDFILNSLT